MRLTVVEVLAGLFVPLLVLVAHEAAPAAYILAVPLAAYTGTLHVLAFVQSLFARVAASGVCEAAPGHLLALTLARLVGLALALAGSKLTAARVTVDNSILLDLNLRLQNGDALMLFRVLCHWLERFPMAAGHQVIGWIQQRRRALGAAIGLEHR